MEAVLTMNSDTPCGSSPPPYYSVARAAMVTSLAPPTALQTGTMSKRSRKVAFREEVEFVDKRRRESGEERGEGERSRSA